MSLIFICWLRFLILEYGVISKYFFMFLEIVRKCVELLILKLIKLLVRVFYECIENCRKEILVFGENKIY